MSRGPWREAVERNRAIMAAALEAVQSVPYRVSLRWLFYRLIELGLYGAKGDYKHFTSLQSRYRKEHIDGWKEDTIVDDTRTVKYNGHGALSEAEAVDTLLDDLRTPISHFRGQEYYVEAWYEAEAMSRQFQHYTRGITLRPFKGDYTIEPKWRTAKQLEYCHERYGLPIVITYFGDLDAKGLEIPENACRDVREWCSADFTLITGGLTQEQIDKYKPKPNPDRPGQFQWEALTDSQAAEVIHETLAPWLNVEAQDQADEDSERLSRDIRAVLEQWRDGGGA